MLNNSKLFLNLFRLCSLPGGHDSVADSLSMLRLKFGEPVRFKFLIGELSFIDWCHPDNDHDDDVRDAEQLQWLLVPSLLSEIYQHLHEDGDNSQTAGADSVRAGGGGIWHPLPQDDQCQGEQEYCICKLMLTVDMMFCRMELPTHSSRRR